MISIIFDSVYIIFFLKVFSISIISMRNWKQDRFRRRSIDSIVSTDNNKNNEASEQRLQTIFQSIKRILSIILKFSTFEEQLQHFKSQPQIDEIGHKIGKYCRNIKEEFFIIQSIELNQAAHTRSIRQQRSNLLVLNRRIKMLLRLVMPNNQAISKQQQTCYLKYENMIEKGNREAFASHESLLQKFEKEIAPECLKIGIRKQKATDQNGKLFSVSYCFFLEIIIVMVEQAIKVKNKLGRMIKEKQKSCQTLEKKSMKSFKSVKIISDIVRTLPTSGCVFENRNEINTFQAFLKDSIYETMDLDRIQVLVNSIPGLDSSANLSLNYDKQIKRNKKMKKDIKNYQSDRSQKQKKKEIKHYSQQQPQKCNNRTNGQNKRFKSQHNTLIVKNSNIRLRIVSKPKANSQNKPDSKPKLTLFSNENNQKPSKSQSKSILINHKKTLCPISTIKPRKKLTLKIR